MRTVYVMVGEIGGVVSLVEVFYKEESALKRGQELRKQEDFNRDEGYATVSMWSTIIDKS